MYIPAYKTPPQAARSMKASSRRLRNFIGSILLSLSGSRLLSGDPTRNGSAGDTLEGNDGHRADPDMLKQNATVLRLAGRARCMMFPPVVRCGGRISQWRGKSSLCKSDLPPSRNKRSQVNLRLVDKASRSILKFCCCVAWKFRQIPDRAVTSYLSTGLVAAICPRHSHTRCWSCRVRDILFCTDTLSEPRRSGTVPSASDLQRQ